MNFMKNEKNSVNWVKRLIRYFRCVYISKFWLARHWNLILSLIRSHRIITYDKWTKVMSCASKYVYELWHLFVTDECKSNIVTIIFFSQLYMYKYVCDINFTLYSLNLTDVNTQNARHWCGGNKNYLTLKLETCKLILCMSQ